MLPLFHLFFALAPIDYLLLPDFRWQTIDKQKDNAADVKSQTCRIDDVRQQAYDDLLSIL